jgi:hypothetical protein
MTLGFEQGALNAPAGAHQTLQPPDLSSGFDPRIAERPERCSAARAGDYRP